MTAPIDRGTWEEAGLTHPQTWELGRSLLRGTIWVPALVEVDNNRLYWAYAAKKEKGVRPDLLENFIHLSQAPLEQIRDFAKQWGVLEICKHGYPSSHNSQTWPRPWRDPYQICSPLEMPDRKLKALGRHFSIAGWDPIDRWRYFSRQAGSILNLAAALYKEGKGSPDDWNLLFEEYEEDWDSLKRAPRESRSPKMSRLFLANVINDWLQLGGVRPAVFLMEGTDLRLELGGPNLFSFLGIQLALAVSRTDQMAICSNCGRPYIATGRRPAINRRSYCLVCRDSGVPQRDAARDYRSRTKEGKKPRSLKRGGTHGSQGK
jgi:hypothetical protein